MSSREFYIEDQEWAKELETSFENYLAHCEELIDCEPELDEQDYVSVGTISGEDFCGCQTCYTREQLFFLVPRIIKAYKEGKITVEE